jgi:hypothetical protein
MALDLTQTVTSLAWTFLTLCGRSGLGERGGVFYNGHLDQAQEPECLATAFEPNKSALTWTIIGDRIPRFPVELGASVQLILPLFFALVVYDVRDVRD